MGKKQPQIHFIFRLRYWPASQQPNVPYVTDGTKTEAIASLLDEVRVSLFL